MGIGALSPRWRRILLRGAAPIYVRRRCTTPDGVFEAYVSGGSSLKAIDPRGLKIDPVHRSFIRDWVRADSIVWDIGGNLGLFGFPAALKAREGRVYVFEPDVEIARNLLRALRLKRNEHLNISSFCLAVSDVDGTADFVISRFSRAMNKLAAVGDWNAERVSVLETRSVATLKIDTLVGSLLPPSVIKIDVEGAEMKVLHGGETTIAKHRPVILIEGPAELAAPMAAFFGRQRYVMVDGGREPRVVLDHPVWDTIAVPEEKFAGEPG